MQGRYMSRTKQIKGVRIKDESVKAGPTLMPISALVSLLLLFSGCEKELNIANFADEYGDYQPELRIEAILDVVEPWDSIVRIDRTILVTDTVIFNGRDDDGDWDPLTDDVGEDGFRADPEGFGPPKDEGEGNGRPDPGEPHVDELDEILPQLHDSTAAVALFDLTLGGSLAMDFAWDPRADSFTVEAGPSQGFSTNEDDVLLEVVTYGGYKPVSMHTDIDLDHLYLFRITTSEQAISGVVQPLPPPVFDLDPQSMIGDTLVVTADDSDQFTWITSPEATVFWIQVEEVLGTDSLITVVSHPSMPFERRSDGFWIGQDVLSFYLPGLYRWTVSVPSRAYGAYVYSQLPMRDEQLSNLRDQDGTVVLGIAGSAASASQYVRITSP